MKPFSAELALFVCAGLFSHINLQAQATRSYVVPEGTRIQVRLESTLNSKANRQGDRFTAKVIESVQVRGKEVIPAGTTVEGRVAEVRQAGRIKGRAEVHLSYERLIFPNGVSETIIASQAELDDTQKEEMDRREGTILGESNRRSRAAEIGAGAAIGAGIGAIAGGRKGAAIGAGAGGLIGLVDVLRRGGKEIEIPAGTLMVIRLDRPLTVISTR
jgi:hypothetical protein